MKWNKYSIQTTTEAVDFISSMLGELGIEGIEIEECTADTGRSKDDVCRFYPGFTAG